MNHNSCIPRTWLLLKLSNYVSNYDRCSYRTRRLLTLTSCTLVTTHGAFTRLHQLHQTHFKYVHIEKKLKNRLLASGK